MKLEKKVYTDRAEKRKDFWIGVGIFLGLNIALLLIAGLLTWGINTIYAGGGTLATILDSFLYFDPTGALEWGFLSALPFLINLILVIYFALTRSWIAWGMAATLGGLFLLAFVMYGCFLTLFIISGGY